jgi:hypothetical protein
MIEEPHQKWGFSFFDIYRKVFLDVKGNSKIGYCS